MTVKHCYLAFMKDAMPDHFTVKIGYSNNPASRFEQLNSMSFDGPICMFATYGYVEPNGHRIEQFLHEKFRRHRLHHEWFHIPKGQFFQGVEIACMEFGEDFQLLPLGEAEEGPTAFTDEVKNGLEWVVIEDAQAAA